MEAFQQNLIEFLKDNMFVVNSFRVPMACISSQINVPKDELWPKLKLDITLKILTENLRKCIVG